MKLIEKIVIIIGIVIVVPTAVLVAVAVVAELSGNSLRGGQSYKPAKVLMESEGNEGISAEEPPAAPEAADTEAPAADAEAVSGNAPADSSSPADGEVDYTNMPAEDLYKILYGDSPETESGSQEGTPAGDSGASDTVPSGEEDAAQTPAAEDGAQDAADSTAQ